MSELVLVEFEERVISFDCALERNGLTAEFHCLSHAATGHLSLLKFWIFVSKKTPSNAVSTTDRL